MHELVARVANRPIELPAVGERSKRAAHALRALCAVDQVYCLLHLRGVRTRGADELLLGGGYARDAAVAYGGIGL